MEEIRGVESDGDIKGIRVEDSTWPHVERRIANGAIAVLPIGAASKEHGRHLPMNADYRQAQWISERVMRRYESVVWPVLNYGYYPVFVDYPGSISLSEGTFIAVVSEILEGIAAAGVIRVVLLNTGISTIAPLVKAINSRPSPQRYQLINVYSGPKFTAAAERLAEQEWGGHADEIETSIMLAIESAMVDMRQANAAPAQIVRGRFNRSDPAAPNYSPDGVNGDPTLASMEKGEDLLGAMLDDVVSAIENY